ncbi:MAG TPA: hypothetical protein ENI90_08795 [Methylothermaceae bacterium]|nr:hypothetical protein [Methylothermaceae bacterium]
MNQAIALNFFLAVLISILGGIAVLMQPELVFPEWIHILGPTARNLLLVVFYLVAIQALLLVFRYRNQGYLEALFMGGLFLLAAVGMPWYSEINEIPLSIPLILGLVYCGVSHLLYFLYAYRHYRS